VIEAKALVVGCDAGGSSVAALAWRDGAVVGRGGAGPANVTSAGLDAAADSVASAVVQAAGQTVPIAALYVGAAGAGRSAAAGALRDALRERLPLVKRLMVEDDTRVALRSAIPYGPGIVVIAGTGSVAYAERDETRVRVGGTGYLIGDDGSGFAIGRAALRRLTRVYDGRERASQVTLAVERVLGVSSRDALLDAVYGDARGGAAGVAHIASLAPLVLALAGQGELDALSIVRAAAADLTLLVGDAARVIAVSAPRVAFAGGLLHERSALAGLLRAGIAAALPGAAFFAGAEPPEMVAVRLAREALRGEARA